MSLVSKKGKKKFRNRKKDKLLSMSHPKLVKMIRPYLTGRKVNAVFMFDSTVTNYQNNSAFVAVSLYNPASVLYQYAAASSNFTGGNYSDINSGSIYCYQWTAFRTIYDICRVNKVVVTFYPEANVSLYTGATTSVNDIVETWFDIDNSILATNAATGISGYATYKAVQGYNTIRRKVKLPKITYAPTSTTTPFTTITNVSFAGYYNTQDMPQAGLLYIYQRTNMFLSGTVCGRVTVKYHCTFKNKI